MSHRGFGKPSGVFEAKYPGQCGECGDHFEPGTKVMYDEDDDIVHAKCPYVTVVRPYLDPPEGTCPDCNLVHAGECF